MKIRTDFVTNSSSSSFSVLLKVIDTDGKSFPYLEFPIDWEQGGDVSFCGNLAEIAKANSVQELAEKLMNSIHGYTDCTLDEDPSDKSFMRAKKRINDNRKLFIECVTANIPSVDMIAIIYLEREYSAWGEFAALVPENDAPLCEFARKVCEVEGDAQARALKEMIDYINTPDGSHRNSQGFAGGFDIVRYKWEGDEAQALAIAKKLYDKRMCLDIYNGREITEVNLTNSSTTQYAEFDLYVKPKEVTPIEIKIEPICKVKFESGAYWYLGDQAIGDLVYVDGAKEGCLGKVTEKSTSDKQMALYRVTETVAHIAPFVTEDVESIWASCKAKERKAFLERIHFDPTISKKKFLSLMEWNWTLFAKEKNDWGAFLNQYRFDS